MLLRLYAPAGQAPRTAVEAARHRLLPAPRRRSEIAWHTRILHDRVDAAKPVVKARLAPIGEGLQVLVYTPDQPDLFARICGYFERAGFNILDAKIHTTRDGYALDTFLVMGQGSATRTTAT